MCIGSAPSAPPLQPPPVVEKPKDPPTRVDADVKKAGQNEFARAQQLASAASTNVTGPAGVTGVANTNKKKALGA